MKKFISAFHTPFKLSQKKKVAGVSQLALIFQHSRLFQFFNPFHILRPFMFWAGLFLATSIFLPSEIHTQDLTSVPQLERRVTDNVGLLSSTAINQLEKDLKQLEDSTSSQLAVLIIPTTGMESIEQYSIRVVEEWKLGQKGIDNGALLLIAVNDRKTRIEVGYGLEGVLPDVIGKRILDQILTPAFRSKEFDRGVQETVTQLIEIIQTEEIPETLKEDPVFRGVSNEDEIIFVSIFGLLGGLFLTIGLIVSFKQNSVNGIILSIVSIVIIGLIGFFMGSILFGFGFGLFLSGIISFIFGIGSSVGGSGTYSSGSYSGRSSGSWGGSSGGGSFGGGGGSFGGGGASGGW